MKNVLLIGGAGYVGTVITSHFLKQGYKVTVLDNFVYDNQFSVIPYIGDPNYKLVYGDMGDSEVLDSVSKDITDVILLSGLVGDPITKKYPEESEKINETEALYKLYYNNLLPYLHKDCQWKLKKRYHPLISKLVNFKAKFINNA